MDLVKTLVSQLGVTEEQAKGGTGLLLKAAKEKLDANDFQKVLGSIPGASGMLDAAPEDGGGLMGMLGKAVGGQAGDVASLVGGFSKLGLNADMIQKFLPVIMGFLKEKGGADVVALLQKVLKP